MECVLCITLERARWRIIAVDLRADIVSDRLISQVDHAQYAYAN